MLREEGDGHGLAFWLSQAWWCVVLYWELTKTKNPVCISPVQLLQATQCDEQSLVISVLHLSRPLSSLLSLFVNVWPEKLPLSAVLMGSFHGGLRLEWIDRRQYPCCGKFASFVQAWCCCSSSYSSSYLDVGKSQLQLHALWPVHQARYGLVWVWERPPAHSCCTWPSRRLSVCLHQLHHPMEVISHPVRWFPPCGHRALIKAVITVTT